MRPLLLAALLLAACGDDSTVPATASSSSGGGPGTGGETAQTATTGDGSTSDGPAVVSVASSSGASGGDGGAGGATSTSTSTATTSGTSGGEGGGGGAPACPDAPCPQFGVICDPSCPGGEDCSAEVCTDDPDLAPHQLAPGTTIIRTPPIVDAEPACVDNCGPEVKWALRMQILGDSQCVRVVAPDGFGWAIGSGENPVAACGGGAACTQVQASGRWLIVDFRGESAPGSELRVTISDDSPCFTEGPDCDVGCNGAE